MAEGRGAAADSVPHTRASAEHGCRPGRILAARAEATLPQSKEVSGVSAALTPSVIPNRILRSLTAHDRVDGDRFPLTQESLSQMLGVHRASVTTAMAPLRQAGLVRYQRGEVTILGRPGLEAATCECYRLVRDRFDRMPGLTGGTGRLLSSGLHATSR